MFRHLNSCSFSKTYRIRSEEVFKSCSAVNAFMWNQRMLTAHASPAERLQQTLVNHGGELQRREEEAAAPQTSSSPITMMTYSSSPDSRCRSPASLYFLSALLFISNLPALLNSNISSLLIFLNLFLVIFHLPPDVLLCLLFLIRSRLVSPSSSLP